MVASTPQLQEQLDSLWTMGDICRALKKTSMTIHNWRRERHLPYIIIEGDKRPAIRFAPKDVISWAKQQGLEVHPVIKRPRKRKRTIQ